MSKIRGFDPDKVSRKHIASKTLIYGSDLPGLLLRLERFIDILKDNGDQPRIYGCSEDALGFLLTGDMFSDKICVVVKDVSDMLKTTQESKHLYKEFVRAVKTYDENSTIVLAADATKNTSALKQFIDDFEKMGGLVRIVEAPQNNQLSEWLEQYLLSCKMNLSTQDKEKILEASDYDIDNLKAIIESVGNEIPNLSVDEIKEWMDTEKDISGNNIRQWLLSGDIDRISYLRKQFAPTNNGYRMFLLKIRHNIFDILLAALSKKDPIPLYSYKQGQYNNSGNIAYIIVKEDIEIDDKQRYVNIYEKTNNQLTELLQSKQPSIISLMQTIAN